MYKAGMKLTEEILDFRTIEDFLLLKKDYKQSQKVQFLCKECNEPVIRTMERITGLLNKGKFNFLCRNCQRKVTSQRLYGCDSPAQAQQVKDKIAATHLKNGNGEWMSQSQKEAITKAFKEKGEQIIAHRKETCMKKYGVSNQNKVERVKEKIRQTNLERRGVEYAFQSEEVKEKSRQTNLEKRGVDNAHKAPEVIQKTKETCKEVYGSESFFSSEVGKEKIKKVFKEKYGVENPSQVKEFQDKKTRKYFYQNTYFDSSWELAVWIYAKDHNEEIGRCPLTYEYVFENVTHKYYPDFKYKGEIIEVKGPQFFKNDHFKNPYKNKDKIPDSQIEAKMKCAMENGVKIWSETKIKKFLTYIKETYGPDYLKQFRVQ